MKTSERIGIVVEVSHLTKTYRLPFGEPVEALASVDARFEPGGLSVIAGPSGSGKSTLLRQMALIERPSSGEVRLDGRDTTALSNSARRRMRGEKISYVFQRPTDNLIAGLRSVDQLHLAARIARAPKPDAESILELLGLAEHMYSNPLRLSGGQQQRLALATALAARASLVLADEPTAQLDRASSASVIGALQRLAAEGPSVIVCSHDDDVIDAGDHVVRLASGRVMEGTR